MLLRRDDYDLIFRKQTGYWYYKERPNGKVVSTKHKDQDKADLHAQRMIRAYREDSEAPTLKEYLKPFFTKDCPRNSEFNLDPNGGYVGYSDRYKKGQKAIVNNHVVNDELATMPIDQIETEDIDRFIDRLMKRNPTSTSLKSQVLKALKIVFKKIRRQSYRKDNPATGISARRTRAKKKIPFTIGDVKKLFFTEPSPFPDQETRVAFLLDICTGMRRNELLALKWCHVKLHKPEEGERVGYGKINVCTAIKGDTEDAPIGYTKTGADHWSYLAKTIAFDLYDYKKAREEAKYPTSYDDFVFCKPNGQRQSFSWWNRNFHKALKNAGIDREGRPPHVLRHSLQSLVNAHSSFLMDAMQRQIGWESKDIQMRTYTTEMDEGLKYAAAGIEILLEKARNYVDTNILR